jgi:multidrug efflux pump subunit AcrB
MFSLIGLVALSGVVVNDSLVMVDYINRRRRAGDDIGQAIRVAGPARFRAILLTSLTTFAGLTPLMLETSVQAQMLIPMAISLAFGVIFATAITLMLVPATYLILEDVLEMYQSLGRREQEEIAPNGLVRG